MDWQPTGTSFDERFKSYLDADFFEHKIHWFSIVNSFMMVILLVGFVALILIRTLKNDFAKVTYIPLLSPQECVRRPKVRSSLYYTHTYFSMKPRGTGDLTSRSLSCSWTWYVWMAAKIIQVAPRNKLVLQVIPSSCCIEEPQTVPAPLL